MTSQLKPRPHLLALATVAVLAAAPAFAADRVNLSSLDPDRPVAGFIVAYKSGTPKSLDLQRQLDTAVRTLGQKDLSIKHVRPVATGGELIEVNRPLDVVAATTLMQQIASNPDVDYIEPNSWFTVALTPNDPSYPSQYGLGGTWGIRANTAWDNTYQGQGTIIAVVDTGITSHPDLAANLTSPLGYDFITNVTAAADGNGRDNNPTDPGDFCSPNPSSWHGTHVTGIAAAVTNNAVGVAGTAFKSKVLSVRVLGKCGGSLADIADGITWASGGTVSGVPAVGANKATVINMSLGGSGACSSTFQTAINGAVSRGVTVVVAAGNSNANAANFQPASCANVINVGATTSAGVRASFSNWGASVDLAAPGQSILSTLNSGSTTTGSPTYANYSGTSMAAPFVAGVVALMKSKPGGAALTPAQIESIIKAPANITPFPVVQNPVIGSGILNADKATDAVP
ncbi:S8 family peptidase [Lysobacter capsici]|uniref:S8 family peptidase n=1 Tax=Lysobacter capsici TaxID=435897 RepID=UPI000BBB4AAE|nr:S8 family peptidase [Lysobacter capsici]ATE70059.1 peptidase S8 [Lysobacter capsici]